MSQLRDSLLGRKDQGIVAEAAEYCPSLTYKTRLYGFAILLALAWLAGILSGVMLFVSPGNLTIFAVLYTVSNLLGLGSTFFLVGPKNQIKKMFKPVRLWSAVAFLVFMGLTLVAALALKPSNAGLVICFAVLQYLSLLWYTLSYIPGARQCFLACCKKTTGLGNES